MSRDVVPGRHWLVVLACLLVAALPERMRERIRGAALDLVSRASPGEPGGCEEASPTDRERALANRIALLETEQESLARDLEKAGAAREIAASADLRLIPAEAFPLAGAADPVKRLVLGRGQRDGVRAGAPVLEGNALVGLTGLVTRDRSEVRLVTDPTFRLRATDARARQDGLVYGTGGPLLAFVPAPSLVDEPEKAPRKGDVLLASRASTLCGLPAVLGTIVLVERAHGEGFLRAQVAPAVDLARLERVVVVRQNDESALTDALLASPREEERR
ncbi:hypothetical protein HY251_15090 [bacterium]|nr:hypothetical protein [bacterium]